VALQQPDDCRLARRASALNDPRLFVLVHEPGTATDEGFVHLNLTLKPLGKGLGLHRQPDTVEHEPRGLLGHSKGAVQLVATDPVLGVDQQPDRGEPLVQPNGGVLEDRAQLDGELLLAALALPDTTGGQERVLVGPTAGAGDAIGPAEPRQEGKAHVLVSEVPDGLYQGSRSSNGLVHRTKDTTLTLVCQVCYCPNKRMQLAAPQV
jgi:hypothetical protein